MIATRSTPTVRSLSGRAGGTKDQMTWLFMAMVVYSSQAGLLLEVLKLQLVLPGIYAQKVDND